LDPKNLRHIYAGTASLRSVIVSSPCGGNHWSVIDAKRFDNSVGVSRVFVYPDGMLYVALLSKAASVVRDKNEHAGKEKEADTEKRYAQIGQLKVENDFLKKLQ